MSISRTTLLAAIVASSWLAAAARGEDVAANVAGRLRDSGAVAGHRVSVRAKAGTVWLEGRVADEKQLATAVGIAETSPGVERVVNRLVIESRAGAAGGSGLGMPASSWSMVGGSAPAVNSDRQPTTETRKQRSALPAALFASSSQPRRDDVQLTGAFAPGGRPPVTVTAGGRTSRPPQPLAAQGSRPLGMPTQVARMPAGRGGVRPAGMGEPMTLPAPGGYGGPVGDGQIVPGTVRYSEGFQGGGGAVADYGNAGGGGAPGGYSGGPGGYAGPQGGYGGGPMPMGGTGVGMPPVPVRGDGPNMPNYAWPSYSAYPNYAALQYPTQYSPTAWPYIGPFYPYPQVPLGWRRVSLEWDDGWWWLDFDERHIHSHHR